MESRTLKTGYVVDNRSSKVSSAHWINDHLNAVELESEIAHALLFVKIETVLIPRASTANDADTKEVTSLTLFVEGLGHGVDSRGGKMDRHLIGRCEVGLSYRHVLTSATAATRTRC